jgi:hypothetical protein
LSPEQHDVDAFFTDQSQQKSFEEKSDDDGWDETRHWVDELHHFNSTLIPQQQTREVGPLGMSRDSLNGTITGINLLQSTDNRREHPMSPLGSASIEQVTPTEADLNAEVASITYEQLYPVNHTRFEQTQLEEQQRSTSFELKTPTDDEQKQVSFSFSILNYYFFK